MRKKYRNFGFSFGIVLAVLGTFHLIRGKPYYPSFYIVSFVILLIALIFPIVLKPLFILFSWLAIGIGWIITTLVLALLFYLIITPIGLVLRACRKDFMGKRPEAKGKFAGKTCSYWHVIENQNRDYEKQF